MRASLTETAVSLFATFQFDRLADKMASFLTKVRLHRLRRAGIPLTFVPQGGYFFEIAGDLSKFSIHPTSHIKSGTFIECSGGVSIGKHFHVGRGLTIFSSAHNYKNSETIPYDAKDIHMPVRIDDFVWCGANVMILPGVHIGEGAIVGAGSVVSRNVADHTIVGGIPARRLGVRDVEQFERLKATSKIEGC